MNLYILQSLNNAETKEIKRNTWCI